jgi:2-oxoglutarate ferredoxin oxidoreductase subunit alpha
LYYLYNRPLEITLKFIAEKFTDANIAEANRKVLKAGYLYGEVSEFFPETYRVRPAALSPGLYRNMTGNQATAWGAIAAAVQSKLPLFFGSYPITPASDVLHELSKYKNFDVTTFQAEDEIAAICATIGAAFTGQLAVTSTSGPGVALKSEGINLAVSVELPIVIIDVQRGGPSTGLPTKTEQADLLQALYGRNSDSPVAIVAPATPSECFTMMIEACRIALKYMVPTFFLSDGYLANGSEPWLVPSASDLPKVEARFTTEVEGFHPFRRDPDTLARNWAVPGTPGLEHRIGGIEKSYDSGNISYDPDNHEKMIHVRQEKVDRIARDLAPTEIFGSQSGGDLLILGWGSTYGAIRAATTAAREQGKDVSHVHIRHLNPLPNDLGDILKKFRRVLIPEMNMGQLSMVIRAKYLVDAKSYSKVQGKPFKVSEILARIERELAH